VGVVTMGSATTTPWSRFFAEIAPLPRNGVSLEQKNDFSVTQKWLSGTLANPIVLEQKTICNFTQN